MFSETGSRMIERLENASEYCSAAIATTLKLLDGPPANRGQIGEAIGSLYKDIYRLDGELRGMGKIVSDVLVEPYEMVVACAEAVEERLEDLNEKGSDDSLYFVLWAGRLLPPLRDLKRALEAMENTRRENSKMNRA